MGMRTQSYGFEGDNVKAYIQGGKTTSRGKEDFMVKILEIIEILGISTIIFQLWSFFTIGTGNSKHTMRSYRKSQNR